MTTMPCPIHALRNSDATAVIDADRRLSYCELDATVTQAAMKIEPGARIALCPGRDIEAIVKLFAIWRAQATACLISTRFPEKRCRELQQLVGAKPLNASVGSPSTALDLDAEATIMFSSGSTGEPKAALHSVGNHYYSAVGANANMSLAPGDRWRLSLPLYHVGGLAILWRCFLAGAAVVIDGDFTHASVVPAQLVDMLTEPPAGLKAVLLGGAVLPPGLCRQAVDAGLPLHTTYGCTEMASQVTTGSNPETAGRLLEHRELGIADDGEILLRGKTLFKGYVTADSVDPARDDDGWYHSGDLGKLVDGELCVIGRKDNMFISGGENVHPETIERCLLEVEGVTQAIVVSVPDSRYGSRPVAFLEGTWNDEGLRRHLGSLLPRFMVPDAFLELPATAGLKVRRPVLEQFARERLGGSTSKTGDPE